MSVKSRVVLPWLGLLLILLGSGGARAHAVLLHSVPAEGSLLNESPAWLVLQFNERVSPLVLTLIGPDGEPQRLEGVQSAQQLRIEVPAALAPGNWLLSWRVVSADGHPIAGALAFAVGVQTETEVMPPAAGSHYLAIWSARVAVYLGLILGVGGACASLWLGTGPSRPVIAALWLGAGALPLSLGLQGVDALGLPMSGLLASPGWQAAMATSYGHSVGLALLALAGAGGTLWLRRYSYPLAWLLSAAVVLLLGLAFTVSGHAASAEPRWLSRPALGLHVLMVMLWLGALPPLFAALARPGADARRVLGLFSRWAPWMLAGLVLSGGVLGVIQLGHWRALTWPGYSRILLLKLALVALVLVLAAWNRWRLTARVQRGEAAAHLALRRLIRLELGLLLVVLGLVAAWRFTPPPRTLLPPGQVQAVVADAGLQAVLTLSPGKAGPVRADILLQDAQGRVREARELALLLSHAQADIAPFRRQALPLAPGHWLLEELLLPAPGDWSVTVEVLVSDFERIRLSGTLRLAP
ncbi:copper resistance CopC/CopD family protein [Zobellella iuensis]|uniref:Copper resistance protein C n=1 Tax=Zobellella iuensis TaxID=2803811 RepID=A0ABS1QXQ4_9GAMM|nr:copper resistance protein CopC [Zobellella iuensis]MBL1379521.1 copper resistance protein CopC/CopD [Zobellella iuensis]